MDKTQLRKWIDERKVEAFNLMATSRRVDPKIAGYATYGDLCADTVARVSREIEAKVQLWEKQNG